MRLVSQSLLILLLGSALAMLGTPIRAQPTPVGAPSDEPNTERIRSFEVDATIHADGSVDVVETIRVVFPERRRGLIRKLVDSGRGRLGQTAYTPIEVLAVTDDNAAPHPFRVEHWSHGPSLRIGDPNVWFTGERTYRITYRVTRLILFHDDAAEDELYWNVTGNDWMMPIDEASIRVKLPPGAVARTDRARGWVGASGSTEHLERAQITSDGGGEFRLACSRELGVYEGFTIAVRWPSGHVIRPTLFDRLGWIIQDSAGLLWLIGVSLGMFAVALLVRMFGGRNSRALTDGALVGPATITLRGELTPIEAGVLIDGSLDPIDLTAQTVDLATRGYLILHDKDGDAELAPGPRFTDRAGLPEEDVAILDTIATADGTVLAPVLRPDPGRLKPKLGPLIMRRLRARGLVKPAAASGTGWLVFVMVVSLIVSVFVYATNQPTSMEDAWFPVGFMSIFLAVGCAAGISKNGPGLWFTLIWGGAVSFMLAAIAGDAPTTGQFDFVAGLSILGATLLTTIAARIVLGAGRYNYLTPNGLLLLERVRSFEGYLRDRARFEGTASEAGAEFERNLPYAIALGLAEAWASRFNNVAIEERPSWLRSRSKFKHWSDIGRRTNRCANGLRQQYIYIPRTSSGGSRSSSGFGGSSYSGGFSGGGGSSGGGFGGGGGGSW